MRSTNDNEAITRLPVLLLSSQENSEGWVTASEGAQVHGQKLIVLKRFPVRVVPESALAQFASPKTRAAFEATYGRVPEEFARQLLSMLGIVGAAETNDLGKVAMLAERAAPKGLAASWAKLNAVISPWNKAAATLNTGLLGTMPVLWQKESQLAPALLCRTPQMALFAHALFAITGKYGLRGCRRCGTPFFASRNRQSFCSYKCRTAEAMKRYRANLKLKESRSRKRGRRTKP